MSFFIHILRFFKQSLLPVFLLLIISSTADAQRDLYEPKKKELNRAVLNIPAGAEKNFDTLAEYFHTYAQTAPEKAWIIYRWITTNINYQTEVLDNLDNYEKPGAHLLKSRTAVCDGYSFLFLQLSSRMNLDAKTITGWARGYSPPNSEDEAFGDYNRHAWNTVKIGSEWKLIDATWGSGYIGPDGSFQSSPNDYYFFTPPKQFAIDHFPEDSRWQLVDKPLTKEAYLNQARLEPNFFNYGLGLISHMSETIRYSRSNPLLIHVPKDIQITAQIVDENDENQSHRTLITYNEQTASVHLAPAQRKSTLRLFARRVSDSDERLNMVAEYDLISNQIVQNAYPEQYKTFFSTKANLIGPLQKYLNRERSYRFALSHDGDYEFSVIYNNQWTQMETSENGVHEAQLVTKVPGTLDIATRVPGTNKFEILLRYYIR